MYIFREMLAIGIQGDNIVVSPFFCLHESGLEGHSFAAVLRESQHCHLRKFPKNGRCAVCGAIVHHHYGKAGSEGTMHDIPQRAGVVVRRNQDEGIGGGLHYSRETVILVQRVPSARESVISAVALSLYDHA